MTALFRSKYNLSVDVIPEYYIEATNQRADFAYFEYNKPEDKMGIPLIALEHEQGSSSQLGVAIDRLIRIDAKYRVIIWWSETKKDPQNAAKNQIEKRADKILIDDSEKASLSIIVCRSRQNDNKTYSKVNELDILPPITCKYIETKPK